MKFSREGLLHMYYFIFVYIILFICFFPKLYGFITLRKTQCKGNGSVIDGKLVSVHASSVVDRGFDPR